jgi:hypothetical protein
MHNPTLKLKNWFGIRLLSEQKMFLADFKLKTMDRNILIVCVKNSILFK